MPAPRHLARAPLTEALINFQVNASEHWDPAAIRAEFAKRWTNHTQINEIRPAEFELTISFGSAPKQTKQALPPQGFIFKSEESAFRYGGMGSHSASSHHTGIGKNLKTDALAGWDEFESVLKPKALDNVSVRFINRLQFDVEEYDATHYFATPPPVFPNRKWRLRNFQQRATYMPPDSPCDVRVITSPAFVTDSHKNIAFMLDIEVVLREPFTTVGRSLESVLTEMHDLKNEAFFNILTEEALQRYI